MTRSLSALTPKNLWEKFEDICSIPHPSKKEAKLLAYVKDFAGKLGLNLIQDETGNILIRKEATAGMEDRKAVVLQAHLDMVPQKNSGVKHDFEVDPIKPYIDGEWVKAQDTTLGADNGIGVATALAVLASDSIQHPPLEVLLTVDEEAGMTGAFGLKADLLESDILINLDSEDEGELCIGCAGGVRTRIKVSYQKDSDLADNMKSFKVSVSGLKGGHSAIDIASGRDNAIRIVNRFLLECMEKWNARLAKIAGGSLENAIPREAEAVIVLADNQETSLLEFSQEFSKMVKTEIGSVEDGFTFNIEPTETPKSVIDSKTALKVVKTIFTCMNGVMRMHPQFPSSVETSSNLGVVETRDDVIEILTLQRSSIASAKDHISKMVTNAFSFEGVEIEVGGSYPGWNPNLESQILKVSRESYKKLYDVEPKIAITHGGLECGLIGSRYPNMEMISFGPTIQFPHSPDERVNIPTVKKYWDFLLEVLANIPKA